MKRLLLTAGILMAAATTANAAPVEVVEYSIKNATKITSSGDVRPLDFGLWTDGAYADDTFSIDEGFFTIFEDDVTGDFTGTLVSTAINDDGYVATIDLALGGFAETFAYKGDSSGPAKTAGRLTHDPVIHAGEDPASNKFYTPVHHDSADLASKDNWDIDFFAVIGGTIDIDLGGSTESYAVSRGAIPYTFQFGRGANDKNPFEFGASTWLHTDPAAGKWDINIAFEVAEPSTAILFGLGIAGLGLARRRQKSL